jgi:hypothetical protein
LSARSRDGSCRSPPLTAAERAGWKGGASASRASRTGRPTGPTSTRTAPGALLPQCVGGADATCPISTGGGTRRVHLVRGGGSIAASPRARGGSGAPRERRVCRDTGAGSMFCFLARSQGAPPPPSLRSLSRNAYGSTRAQHRGPHRRAGRALQLQVRRGHRHLVTRNGSGRRRAGAGGASQRRGVLGAGVVRGMRGRAGACPGCAINVKWSRLVRESDGMCWHWQAACFRTAR